MTSDMTTLKIRKATRDLFNEAARGAGLTADAYLSRLLDDETWRARMAQAKAVMATPDDGYAGETAEWDALSDDGLGAE
ncbi:MAG: hypothetical protein F2881_05890 [Actinobacteria bacterium]|uniref:Unannotated protein n=1 Tax=freshwater metagenome TaxID=449393 RepID=A0A6J7PWL7_9ZZZZ|nr:hypothetical protein [Actinomycetota bacterium]